MWVKINPQRRHLKIRKSAESQRVLDALNAYVDDNSNEPMKWLVSMWQDQQNAFGYEQLRQIVLDEISPQAIFDKWFQDYSGFIREKMTPLWRQGIAAGAYSHPRIQALQAEGFKVVTSSANVRSWLLDRTAELVTNCTNNQIESLRYIIAEARSKGLSSDETARYIRPTIGLTRQQAGANMKLYESTKAQLRKDHPRMTDESIERKARDIAAKDAAKKQRTRAVTIARTENAYAYNYGNDEAIKQAEAAGLMPHMVPYWSTSHSGNVCPVCEELEGMPIDEGSGEFSVTWHNRDYTCELPPMHPRCMCAVEYREESEEISPVSGDDMVDNSPGNDRMDTGEDDETFEPDTVSIPDTLIHRSLGAAARNYSIIDPESGEEFKFVDGSKIQNSEVFAGHGTKHPLYEEVAQGLSEQIGGDPQKWQHCKGIGHIDVDGEDIKAEVHWFQEASVGKHKFKIKKWLDDES